MLFDRTKTYAIRSTSEANQHAQRINTHIEEIMQEAGISWQQLSALAVLNGPGSYTGLRIGLASAKGFCYALDKPLILINHLDLMHRCDLQKSEATVYVLKARDNEYFMKTFDAVSGQLTEAELVTKDELLSLSAGKQLLTSDAGIINDFEKVTLIHIEPDGLRPYLFSLYDAANFADLMHCEPFYLKNVFINKINKL
jgi:tRNA threonylcarbamoyladenosine biosynthesis protein TsaB